MSPQNDLDKSGIKILAAGLILGIGIALFTIAGYHTAGSPVFCMACHSMKDTGKHWQQSLHKQFACIECHLPDSNIIVQVVYKTKAGLDKARELVRKAQWFWDMVAAENGMGFHNPDQALNTLGRSIDMAHQAIAAANEAAGTEF